jgi:O-antigen/teichoic acid export membrane protein
VKRILARLGGPGLGASLVRASVGSAILRIAGLGFGFLLALLLARTLGPASYGIYGTAMAIIAVLTVVAELGMPRLVTREVAAAELAEDWDRIRGVLAWSRRVALGISLAIALAVGVWAWVGWGSEPILLLTLLIGIAWVPLVTLSNIDAAALSGLRHLIKGQISEVLLRPALFAMFLFLATIFALPLTPVSAITLSIVSAAIAYCACAILLRANLPHEVRGQPRTEESQSWLKSALPIALSDGVRVGQAQVVIMILAAMADDATTGTYRAAASIFVLFALPEAMFNLVTAPIMARLHNQGDRARLQRMMFWAAAASTAATLVLVAPFIIFGEELVVLLLGEEFRATSAPLAILSIAAVGIAANGPTLVLMNIAGHDREVVRSGAIALVVLLVTAVPLIGLMGTNGAAVAFGISSFLWRLVVRQRAKSLLGVDPSILSFRAAQAREA